MKVLSNVVFVIIILLTSLNSLYAKDYEIHTQDRPKIFLFISGIHHLSDLKQYSKFLENKNIYGVQILFRWKDLETSKDKYDLKLIGEALDYLDSLNKKLWIQLQDRSFIPTDIPVPKYILSKEYNGGIAKQRNADGYSGWITKQWNKKVRDRFQKLITAISKKYDGKIYGINLPETAVDLEKMDDTFCHSYFDATYENMIFLNQSFKQTKVVQYVNYFPCEWANNKGYTAKIFQYAIKHSVGLGSPDIVPCLKNQMSNTYPLFHKYKDKLFIAMAVQEADYWNIRQVTGQNFRMAEFYNFAKNYLGTDIIFWGVSEPNFSKRVYPEIQSNKLFNSKINAKLSDCKSSIPKYYEYPKLDL
ncbi:hypothetical protein [Cysteiniphilum halobium]|uniref:hypothetical protein n=1 Tax=Cysteiniphilum halobium TaxID=2219059 RepID=UPI003F8270C0